MQTINYKQFYTPLENALISTSIRSLLSKLHAPDVISKEIDKIFQFVPSLFPHFLFNYSDFTFGYIQENTIKSNPSEKEISSKRLDWNSRGLSLNNNQILIPGPESQCFMLNLNNETIVDMPDLNQPRKWHAMA